MKFQTERKPKRDWNEDFEKPSKKFKENIFFDQKSEKLMSPLTLKVNQNIKQAYQISQMVLDQVQVFQSKLLETKKQLEEKEINIEDLLDLQVQENVEAKIQIEDLSPIQFESIEKTKKRSEFFQCSQQIQGYAKSLLGFHLNEYQLKPLLDLILGDNVILSCISHSGKSTLINLFIKMTVAKN